MKVLVACEESQAVTKAFRKLGHEAYSCDIQECSGGKPQWHIKGDALKEAYSGKYDLMVAHPPCTYLAVSGARWMYNNDGSINLERLRNQKKALNFVQKLLDAPIDKIALENPVSVISSQIKKPTQIIQPYEFGHSEAKKTCLWLRNLPLLKPTGTLDGTTARDECHKVPPSKDRWKIRSKFYHGIARAMAIQWGDMNYI